MDKFLRVAAGVPRVTPADCRANAEAIVALVDEIVAKEDAQVIVTPEMSVTAYTCGDLFGQDCLLEAAEQGVRRIAHLTARHDALIAVGAPVRHAGSLYNCAVMIRGGHVVGIVPKCYMPTYGEFYETRWWRSGADADAIIDYAGSQNVPMRANQIFEAPDGTAVGVELCEDLWTPVPPSCRQAQAGAQVIVNLSASDDVIGKYEYLQALVAGQSGRCICAYVYASAGFGESSTDLVFDGKVLIAENGAMRRMGKRWQHEPQYVAYDIDIDAINHDRRTRNTFAATTTANDVTRTATGLWRYTTGHLKRDIARHPFVPADDTAIDLRADEIVNIQAAGLARRLDHTHCRSLVVGISGGLDSTLALLVAVKAFDSLCLDRKGIMGITMPGFGTTDRTHDNAVELMHTLGVTDVEIPIGDAVLQHFAAIGHDPSVHDVTYENCQARERTQILMDMANRTGGMVLGTGDLSELALGWATYNGDQMSMYGVNAGVPKTLIKYLVRWFAMRADGAQRRVLEDIIDTPISPELIPAAADGTIAQKTEDLVGPYELHDFFLYQMLRHGASPRKIKRLACQAFEGVYDEATITHWLRTFVRRFFAQQFKRSCMPDGPKTGSICLSPRGDWRMPSDATARVWLDQL